MKFNKKILLLLPFITVAYLLLVLIVKISFTGYWIDILVTVVLVVINVFIVLKIKTKPKWFAFVLKSFIFIPSAFVTIVFILSVITPFGYSALLLETFYYEEVDERLFNAYFKPVGSCRGGEGVFWITESPQKFPFIEIQRYIDPRVNWNFSWSEFDGTAVDQKEIVRDYIKSEIINKNLVD